jgi:hypothetical protein
MKRVLLILWAILSIAFTSPATFGQHQVSHHKKHYKKEVTVYVTNTGSKYHTADCSYLRYSSIPMNKNDAIAQGYTPCSRCNP